MRIMSVLQHLSKYVKILDSPTRLLVDNGEIPELFVQKLGVDLCVIHRVVNRHVYSAFNYLRPLLCTQIRGNCAFSPIRPAAQHWSFLDLSVTCTEAV